jgi:hypothetical protein
MSTSQNASIAGTAMLQQVELAGPVDDYVPEACLSQREKDHLVASFRAIESCARC